MSVTRVWRAFAFFIISPELALPTYSYYKEHHVLCSRAYIEENFHTYDPICFLYFSLAVWIHVSNVFILYERSISSASSLPLEYDFWKVAQSIIAYVSRLIVPLSFSTVHPRVFYTFKGRYGETGPHSIFEIFNELDQLRIEVHLHLRGPLGGGG